MATEASGNWRCIDDGSGKNIYYYNEKGQKSRQEPSFIQYDYLYTGERQYSFRGICLNCRRKSFHMALSHGKMQEVYSLNVCEPCILKTLNISKLRNYGNLVWENFRDSPKSILINLESCIPSPDNENIIHQRAKEAKLWVLQLAKKRRNGVQQKICKIKAAQYGVSTGTYLSWGFGSVYDEYFGKVNSTGFPHGFGVKFYSDGTVYVGGWRNGRHHTEGIGLYHRPDGTTYEGNWMQGRKHGTGEQLHEDGRVYVGEFANGYEHGQGKIRFPNGSIYEGRFRFGRRDGPGVMIRKDGHIEKGNFRDSVIKPEKFPPEISEVEDEKSPSLNSPMSLQRISLMTLAEFMIKTPDKLPSSHIIHRKIPEHLKAPLGRSYLSLMSEGSADFKREGAAIAYNRSEGVTLSNVRMLYNDMRALIYFTEANTALKSLELISARLPSTAIELFCRHLSGGIWQHLCQLDLSFSTIDIRSMQNLVDGISRRPVFKKLRLAGCKIVPNSVPSLVNLIAKDCPLQDLDLAFNTLESKGAVLLAQALRTNSHLTCLNIRQNRIGSEGGMAFANALIVNETLIRLILADNDIGVEATTAIAARLKGRVSDVFASVCGGELQIPSQYLPNRYGVLRQNNAELVQNK